MDIDFIFGLGIGKHKREKRPIWTEILYLIRIRSEESNLFGFRLGFLYKLPKRSTNRRGLFALIILGDISLDGKNSRVPVVWGRWTKKMNFHK